MNNSTLKNVWLPGLVGVLAAVVAVQGVALYRLNSRMAASGSEPEAKPPSVSVKHTDPTPKGSVAMPPPSGQRFDPFGGGLLASDPFAEMERMHQRMNAMMQQAFGNFGGMGSFFDDGFAGFAGTRADIRDQDDSYVVRVKVPGDGKNAKIDVNVEENVLTISSRHAANEEDQQNGQVVRHQRSSTSFEQSIALPGPVDASRIQTKMENGELVVTVPKPAPPKKVSLRSIS